MSAMEETKPLDFTVNWFADHARMWEALHRDFVQGHSKFLEIGSFEGQSACWLLEHLNVDGSLFCIDTWEGSPEISREAVQESFDRFQRNTDVVKGKSQRLVTMKCRSTVGLADLISQGHAETFDFIYVDGGHRALETMTDMCMSWELLKPGGVMVIDDYLWGMEIISPIEVKPKFAVDVFVAAFNPQLRTIACGMQYIVQKR